MPIELPEGKYNKEETPFSAQRNRFTDWCMKKKLYLNDPTKYTVGLSSNKKVEQPTKSSNMTHFSACKVLSGKIYVPDHLFEEFYQEYMIAVSQNVPLYVSEKRSEIRSETRSETRK